MSEEYWFFKNLGVIKHGSVYFCSPTCWLVLAFYWIDIALTLIESRWLQSNSANSLRSAQLFFALSVPIRYYQGFSLLPQYSFSIYFFHFSFFFFVCPSFQNTESTPHSFYWFHRPNDLGLWSSWKSKRNADFEYLSMIL